MRQSDFLKALDERLEENKKLSDKGGMPKELAPVVSLMGFYSWQVLLVLGFLVVGLWFLVEPVGMLKLVRGLLLVRGEG